MTQPKKFDRITGQFVVPEVDRNGLFLVKPDTKSPSVAEPKPARARKSRSMGLLAMAAAALAAPLLWFLHEMLSHSK